MAVTLLMKTKLDRVDIIKTICSHGWLINGLIMDDTNKRQNEIVNAKIMAYSINAKIKNKHTIILYQPDLNELTIIGNNSEIEKNLKNKIGDILEKKKLGSLFKAVTPYVNGLFTHINFLTENELNMLVREVEEQHSDTSNYIH